MPRSSSTTTRTRVTSRSTRGARQCKDCPPGSRRKAPHAGPRCATHNREWRKTGSLARSEAHVLRTYNLTPDEYNALYELQGGSCYICQRATGKVKRLSVDHDHSCCPGSTSCGACVRGLLCRNCNRDVLGHLRDSVVALQRAMDYLNDPPARKVFR